MIGTFSGVLFSSPLNARLLTKTDFSSVVIEARDSICVDI